MAAAAPTTISAPRRPAWGWARTAGPWGAARKARAARRAAAPSPNPRSLPRRPRLRRLRPLRPLPPRRGPPAASPALGLLRRPLCPRGSLRSSRRRAPRPPRLPPAPGGSLNRSPSPAPAPRRPEALRKAKDNRPAAGPRGLADPSRGRAGLIKADRATAAGRAESRGAAGSSTRDSRASHRSRARPEAAEARSFRTR